MTDVAAARALLSAHDPLSLVAFAIQISPRLLMERDARFN